MKKFLISNLVWAGMFAAVLASIIHPEVAGFHNVAMLAMWLIIILGTLAVGSFAGDLTKAKDPESEGHKDALKRVLKLADDQEKFWPARATVSWLETFALTVVAAYAGNVVTAGLYFAVSTFSHALVSAVREFAQEHRAKADTGSRRPNPRHGAPQPEGHHPVG